MGSLDWGIELTPLRIIDSPLGGVMHGMKRSDPGFHGFGEAYFSCIKPGVRKGWKKHKTMTLNLVVPVGEIKFFVLPETKSGEIDLNANCLAYELGPRNYFRLTVPPRLWVGFKGQGTQDSMLLNIASCEHDPNEAETLSIDSVNFDWQ